MKMFYYLYLLRRSLSLCLSFSFSLSFAHTLFFVMCTSQILLLKCAPELYDRFPYGNVDDDDDDEDAMNDKRSRCHVRWHLILDKLLIISKIFSHRKTSSSHIRTRSFVCSYSFIRYLFRYVHNVYECVYNGFAILYVSLSLCVYGRKNPKNSLNVKVIDLWLLTSITSLSSSSSSCRYCCRMLVCFQTIQNVLASIIFFSGIYLENVSKKFSIHFQLNTTTTSAAA